jgi:O-antigen ligase
VVAIGATFVIDPRRISVIWTTLAVAGPAGVCVVLASQQRALTAERAGLDAVHEGRTLAVVLVLGCAASGSLSWFANRVARHVRISARWRAQLALGLLFLILGAFTIGLLAVGGPTQGLTEVRERFEGRSVLNDGDLNTRLFNLSGTGRNEVWNVAYRQFRESPVVGHGAGSFEYLWYANRPSVRVVRDAHSLYLEVATELGVVGIVLLVAALVTPLVAAVRSRRVRYTAPVAGAYAVWIASAALDWHWEMVGVTVTALLLGMCCLLGSERRLPKSPLARRARLLLTGLAFVLSTAAVWSLVGNQALFAARDAVARKQWSEALTHGRRARALLFWSHEPDLVIGEAQAGRGDRGAALRAYRAAVKQDPENWVVWLHLAQVASGAERAAAYDRVHELNPREEGLPGE